MAESRILVVEDEKNVGATLVERLKREGFHVDWATTFADASLAADEKEHDLAVLDVGLPDGSGFDLAAAIRSRKPELPILFLTAFGSPDDRVRGLELGAEDYVVKPFHLQELVLRIRNVLKRSQQHAESAKASGPVRIGKAVVDFARFRAGDQTLTHKECALLKLLWDSTGRVVSRDEILDKVWSEDEFPSPRTVDNFILRLRRIVESDPENPNVIRSVRGVGYQLYREGE